MHTFFFVDSLTSNDIPRAGSEAGSKMVGSWMLTRAVSKEAAVERLSKDVYAKYGAWDMDAVRVEPLASHWPRELTPAEPSRSR